MTDILTEKLDSQTAEIKDDAAVVAEKLAQRAEDTAAELQRKVDESAKQNQLEHDDLKRKSEANLAAITRVESTVTAMNDNLNEILKVYLPSKKAILFSAGFVRVMIKLLVGLGVISAALTAIWNLLHRKV